MARMNKKGYQLGDIVPLVLMLVIAVVVTAVGASITNKISDQQTANSYAANISGQGLLGLNEFGKFFQTIGIVIAASVVIGILVTSFRVAG
jgi:NADH:ubiquinone oxidoreductase subunit 6 (subunit J)